MTDSGFVEVKRALLSVTDKTGIVELGRFLTERGVQIISTGGTANILEQAGIPVVQIDNYTGFPEMLDGRLKTIHPKVHGGLLAKRDNPNHMLQIYRHGIATIDLLAVNLYEFESAAANPMLTFDEVVEQVDIGGPSMVRSAAKSWRAVTVLTSPVQYGGFVEWVTAHGGTNFPYRYQCMVEAFTRTAAYEQAIATYFQSHAPE